MADLGSRDAPVNVKLAQRYIRFLTRLRERIEEREREWRVSLSGVAIAMPVKELF